MCQPLVPGSDEPGTGLLYFMCQPLVPGSDEPGTGLLVTGPVRYD